MDGAAHRRVRINYAIRVAAFGYCFLVLALHGWEHGYGGVFWGLLVLQFLVYPHLVYLRARRSRDGKRAEETNLYVDAVLLGLWIAALGFPVWLLYAALFSTTLNAIVLAGVPGALWSLGCFAVGTVLWVGGGGWSVDAETSVAVSALCFFGSLGYISIVGQVVHTQGRRLAVAREALGASEERYRRIAENAGDLIALVDHFGRWLYASPSYERVLDAPDLKPGTDAFRRVHPDDADQARAAVLRAGHRPRELALRLVDRQGRVRRYETRVQALVGDNAGVLLVSKDTTDLRENEERILVVAHALEGMTDAIVITTADGIITTVNKAFTDITGYVRDDVLGMPERSIRNMLQPPEFYDEMYAAVARHGHWSGEGWAQRKNGSVYREWRSVRAARSPGGATTHYVIVFAEVGAARPGKDTTNPTLRG